MSEINSKITDCRYNNLSLILKSRTMETYKLDKKEECKGMEKGPVSSSVEGSITINRDTETQKITGLDIAEGDARLISLVDIQDFGHGSLATETLPEGTVHGQGIVDNNHNGKADPDELDRAFFSLYYSHTYPDSIYYPLKSIAIMWIQKQP